MRAFLCLLLAAGLARAGEYFRFDAYAGPGNRQGTLHGYIFSESSDEVRIIDRDASSDPKWTTLGDGLSLAHAFAGCNGGLIQPDGKPVGLVIVDSKQIAALDAHSAIANAVILVKGGRLSLTKAASLKEGDLTGVTQGLQAGPLLVDGGQAVTGLDAKSFARHMVLLSSGTGNWAILYVPSATLDGLSKLLADGKSFPKFKVVTALNLGAGLSSALWLARSENALPLYLREVNPVRSGIAILPK